MNLNNLEKTFGDIRVEYYFYERILNSGFVDNLSDEDYEFWENNNSKFIEKIIQDDEIYWKFEEILSNEAMNYINNSKYQRRE